MKKVFLLGILVLFLIPIVTAKGGLTVSHTFPQGFNLMTFPYKPINNSVKAIFRDYPISGNLIRYDTTTQGYVPYYDFIPSKFGNIKEGEGYWFDCIYENCTIKYNAEHEMVLYTMDKVGWYMVGKDRKKWSAKWKYNRYAPTTILLWV